MGVAPLDDAYGPNTLNVEKGTKVEDKYLQVSLHGKLDHSSFLART